MAKVFLLSTNTIIDPYPVYPLGMAIVASALIQSGHAVRQFDFSTEGSSINGLQQAVSDFSPDFIGVSLRNIDSVDSFTAQTSWTLESDRVLVQSLKKISSAPVVLGGSAFSILPQDILEYLGADYGIIGEGGRLFNRWIERFEGGGEVPLISKGEDPFYSGDISLSPIWDKANLKYYSDQGGLIGLRTKRGCPHHCAYCSYPSLDGTKFRYRGSDEVIEDIYRLQKDFQIEGLFFTDSVFNDREGIYLEIAEKIISREIRIRWSAFFQPVYLKEEEFRLLKRSGLFAVEAGTDATSDTTLRGLNKPFTFDEVIRFNEACLKEEIPCAHYVMFGGPGETPDTIQEGIANMDRLGNCVVLAFSGVRILPGTQLHGLAIRDGCLEEKSSLLSPVFYFSPHIVPETMNKNLEEAFKFQRLRIFPPTVSREKVNILRQLGYRGALWDTLVSFKRPRNIRISQKG